MLAAAQNASAFIVYTDRTAWTAAVRGITTETFDTAIAFAQSITFDNGVTSAGVGADTVLTDSNEIRVGHYFGRVDSFNVLSNTYDSIAWTFPGSIAAFGADWIDTTSRGKLTLSGDFDGSGLQTIDLESFLPAPGTGFLGVVGAGRFDTVVLGTRLMLDEAFALDNLSFARSVPAPGSLALLGAGLALLGLRRARRG